MIIKKIYLLSYIFFLLFPSIIMANEQWQLSRQEDGISIFLKTIKDSPVKSFKGEMKVKGKLSSIVALLEDTNAYKSLLHNCKSAKDLKLIGNNETYKYIVTSMPWPVANRDMVTHSVLHQNKQNKQVTITLDSTSGFVPPNPRMVRINTMSGHWLLTPLKTDNKNNAVKIEYEMSLDPGGKIPKWLVNALVVDIPFNTLTNLKKLLNKPLYQRAKLPHITD